MEKTLILEIQQVERIQEQNEEIIIALEALASKVEMTHIPLIFGHDLTGVAEVKNHCDE